MKKIVIPVIILLMVTMVLAGCSSETASTTPATPTATQPVATTPAGTTPATSVATTSKPAINTSTTPTSPVAGAKKYGGTLRWIEFMSPGSPIGWPTELSGPSGMSPQICEQALLTETKDGTLKPRLAAFWDVVTDAANPSITFHLQKGVKFHDGTDFNAQAAKWNLDKITTSALYGSTVINWKSIEAVDDNTLRINLKVWQNNMLRTFADQMAYMVSPTAYDKNGIDWIRTHIVGTGPYVQTDFSRDVALSGTRNPNYWESGKPYLDKAQILFVADEMTRIALFKSGGADILNTNSQGRVANDLLNSGYNVVSLITGPMTLMVDSANADSPFSNLKVRQAMDYAIDKEAIAKTFGAGYWQAAYQFSTPNSKAYDPAIPGRKYDVAKAKQLLTEAGYPNGFKTTLVAGPLFLNRDVVVTIQANMAKIGIVVELQLVDNAKWSEVTTSPWKNQILYTSVNEWGNPNQGFNYYFGTPASLYKSVARPDGWKELLEASRATADPDIAMLKKMENLIYDNVMLIPIYNGSNMWAIASYVQDSGVGQHGLPAWFDPENMWFNK